MKPYFEKMTPFGRELNEGQIKSTEERVERLLADFAFGAIREICGELP